jgi:tetratricopeptide (TPR) repeat protein
MAKVFDFSKSYQRASEAAEKQNYAYAIDLYLDILEKSPDDIKARMALRSVEKAKAEKKGRAAVAAAIAGFPNLLAGWLKGALGKHDGAVRSFEKYLTRDGLSATALRGLARSLEKAGREDHSVVVYETIRQSYPQDLHTLRHLARTYVKRNDIQRAMQRYQLLLQQKPDDIEAAKQVHDLAASESIQEGWDKSDTFQDKMRDKEKASRLEQSQKIIRTSEQAADAVERVKIDLKEDPDRPMVWAELGDLQRRKGDRKGAAEAYEKALELDPKNQLYVQKLMDVQLDERRLGVEAAEAEAAGKPGDKVLADKAAGARKDLEQFRLKELRRRADERPTETALRFELGNAYFDLGMINEATAEFQRVVRDVKFRTAATAMLGKCFAAKGLDELAIGQFEKALADSNIMEENGKDIAYSLGLLYEKTGNLAAAEDTYKKIFETDIGYRDIADRMERVYKIRREQQNNASNPDAGK